MARIRLSVHPQFLPTLGPGGELIPLTIARPTCVIHLGRSAAYMVASAVVDSGSPLSVIPDKVWKASDFPVQEVRWLKPPGDRPPRVSVGGGEYPCRFGSVPVRVVGANGDSLGLVEMIAQFTSDAGKIPKVLLGLRHGVLDGRRFVLEPDVPLAYIEDR